MSLKEIITDLFHPHRIAKKYIILYAFGTFFYGIAFGLVISYYFRYFFENFFLVSVMSLILFLIGILLVGSSYSKILRKYQIKERK